MIGMSDIFGAVQLVIGPVKWVAKKVTGAGRTDIEEEAELREQRKDKKYRRNWVVRQWKRL